MQYVAQSLQHVSLFSCQEPNQPLKQHVRIIKAWSWLYLGFILALSWHELNHCPLNETSI